MKEQKRTSFEMIFLVGFILLKFILSYILVNDIYELHRDEFLHLDQANHLAAGFTSVPPLTSLFSLIIKFLGNGIFWVRFFPALFGVLTMVFCWLIVGKLHGNLYSKCLVAVAFICSVFIRLNILYQPNSFDVLAWTAVFYFGISYFENLQSNYIYCLAISIALGFLNKYNILFLVMGLLPAILITPRRAIFRDRHFYYATLLAVVMISPNVIWQFNNDFPVIHHMKELAETQLVNVKHIDFFKDQMLSFISDIFILLAAFLGFVIYKPFKKHLWVFLSYFITLIIFSYFNAKAYYALGLYPILLAFGSVYITELIKNRHAFFIGLMVFIIGSFVYILPLVMPVYSPNKIVKEHKRFERVGALRWEDGKNHDLPQDYADMQGWVELAKITDSAYAQVKDKSAVVVRADNYGQTGAINYYSKYKDINAVSYNADYLYWFKMDKPIKDLILIVESGTANKELEKAEPFFEKARLIGEVKNRWARERGASVILFEEAKIDLNSRLESEIEERKNDH
ncbi:glycosyltransferase family 39 protein [Pedobacter aquatilis]|uniref:glycosyltransferase family 39 protein n=1 Tax=Pedobacter aquatilis TaxID=351343 RepID=UPI00292DA3D6|nr:glycosyltransferase family 39 protein [Pedobacter aquatilis]